MAKSKIRTSARGEECQIRLEGVCNGNPETTVLCHSSGGGMGLKSNDIHAAYGCSACHDEIDGRTRKIADRQHVQIAFYEGMVRTQSILINKGLIKT